MIEPDTVLREDSKVRSGITVEGSWRKGARVTLIEPERDCKRSSAGAGGDELGIGITIISMEPDMVLMERRS